MVRSRKNVSHRGGGRRRRRRGGSGRRSHRAPRGGNQQPIFSEAGLPYGVLLEDPTPPEPPEGYVFSPPSVAELRTYGVLDLTREGHGFLRNPEHGYEPQSDDPFVSAQLVTEYGLRDGVTIHGDVGAARRAGQNPQLEALTSICGMPPHLYWHSPKWDEMTVIDPEQPLKLTGDHEGGDDITLRIIELLAPIGFGQRGLLVSPPRAGKTMILQKLARAVEINHPEAYLIVLLVDERPEEATAMQRATDGEVAVSTNDNPPENHVRVVETILKKSKRLVETGKNVVILMDSLTRLGRAYNLLQRSGGRTLSGGMDSRSLEKPKAFFGAARNIENGGSLTIVATALIETNSRMDQVIFEEFKGTGNMELVLDRQLAEQRIWPAIDANLSGTRKEEKLLRPDQLEKIYVLRRALQRVRPLDAMHSLIERMGDTPNNDAFLDAIAQPRRSDDDEVFDYAL